MAGSQNGRVYIDCPGCGRGIDLPFYRGTLQPFKHSHGDSERDCKFLVSVDPVGDDHWFRVLDDTERYEAVEHEVWDDHMTRLREAVLTDLLVCMKTERAA